MNTASFRKKIFGPNSSCFIIAEISANHGKSYERAVKMIKAARRTGADAVKFQTYTPDTLTINSSKSHFRVKHPEWGGQSLYDLYKDAYTPWAWLPRLKKVADKEGLLFFSTAFDKSAVDFMEKMDVPIHKIASFEMVDLPLIEYAAATGKPLIISTGMATLDEIRDAVKAARRGGAKEIIILKCVSSYPARPEEMNLRTIEDMKKRFRIPVGLSDHSPGIGVAVAAVGLGIAAVEKHFTLSRRMKTADSFFSMEPVEFTSLVQNIRMAEKAMGKVNYGLTPDQKKSRVFRRSLFAVEDIRKGEPFTEKNLRSIRPAGGLLPKYLPRILGKKARRNLRRGTPVSKEDF